MELSDKLIKEWNCIMTGILKCCKAQKGWKVKVLENKEIQVDEDFKIIAHFMNNEYIRVLVYFKGEEYLEIRHIERYDHTAHPVINFINFNR